MSEPIPPPSNTPSAGFVRLFLCAVLDSGEAHTVQTDVSVADWEQPDGDALMADVLDPAYAALRQHC